MNFVKTMVGNVICIACITLSYLTVKAAWESGLGDRVEEKATKLFAKKN